MRLIADSISALSSARSGERSVAATEIFQHGSERARRAVAPWLQDAEVRSTFVLGGDGFPEMTVGLAVEPGRFEAIRKAMGMPPLAKVPAEHEAREFEVVFPGGVRLDILTTLGIGAAGAIGRFLRRFGEGIQQVELLCRNVDRTVRLLGERFPLTPLYPEARLGAGDTRVNFFLMPAGEDGKLLVELVEPAAGK